MAYAGTTSFKDLHEIKGIKLTREDMLRSFEAYRFRYEGKLCRISIDAIKKDHADFLFSSDEYGKEAFTLYEGERKAFDLDDDYIMDLEIILDEVTKTSTNERIRVTFTTESEALTEDSPAVEIEEELEEKQQTSEENITEDIPEKKTTTIEFMEEKNDSMVPDKPMSNTFFTFLIWLIVFLVILLIVVIFIAIHKHKLHF
jgi:hypothetical protein